jgi:hypothetical protein
MLQCAFHVPGAPTCPTKRGYWGVAGLFSGARLSLLIRHLCQCVGGLAKCEHFMIFRYRPHERYGRWQGAWGRLESKIRGLGTEFVPLYCERKQLFLHDSSMI